MFLYAGCRMFFILTIRLRLMPADFALGEKATSSHWILGCVSFRAAIMMLKGNCPSREFNLVEFGS
jgi:hypothetical protein